RQGDRNRRPRRQPARGNGAVTGRATNTTVILRARATSSRARLEGWPHAPSLLPSFETAARSARDLLRMTAEFVSRFSVAPQQQPVSFLDAARQVPPHQ